jgi:pimeloyl-ACP methyl ester carboxylesterase
LDDRAAEIEAVMEAAGFRQAVVFAQGEGGLATIVFAVTRPERTHMSHKQWRDRVLPDI